MNKARRQEIKQLKYRKRLARIGMLNAETLKNPKGPIYNLTGYKNSSNPCSCGVCSFHKYNRAKVNRGLDEKLIHSKADPR